MLPSLSIIIPHRNRNRTLYECVWSIARSARFSGIRDYEILVVDHKSRQLPVTPVSVRFVICEDRWGVLNKPRLLNLGIEAAKGEVLSFIDADMLVSRKWMEGTIRTFQHENPPHRLGYRVRQLILSTEAHQNNDVVLAWLDALDDDDEAKANLLDHWFSQYDGYVRAWEAYGEPEAGNFPSVPGPVYGNSQFSIRRDALGDVRFNEKQVGAGWEDVWMNWAVGRSIGAEYRSGIFTDFDHALLHIWHGPRKEEPGSDWYPPDANSRNEAIFYEDKYLEQRQP